MFLTIEITDTDGEVATYNSLIGYPMLNPDRADTIQKVIRTVRIKALRSDKSLYFFFIEDGKRIITDYDISSINANITKVERGYDMLSPKRKLAYRGCSVLICKYSA